MNANPLEFYYDIPVVTRTYFSASLLVTALCTAQIITPYTVYFNPDRIIHHYEFWRLITNFCYFGDFGLNYMFQMYYLVRHFRYLEESSFLSKTGDFVYMIFLGMIFISICGYIKGLLFMGPSLIEMIIYVWGRRNPWVRLNFFGVLTFTAPYLVWFFILMDYIMSGGNFSSAISDVVGICAGHTYYYFVDVLPKVAKIRKWKRTEFIPTPRFVKKLFGQAIPEEEEAEVEINLPNEGNEHPHND